MRKYTELHAHDELSNLRLIDSINKTSDLIQEAYNKGLNGVAVTNHDALGSHLKALKKEKEIRSMENYDTDKDFKVLLGNEIYLNADRENSKMYYHFLLIAKDDIGYKQIRRLSTIAWMNSFHDRGMERVVTTYSDLESIVGEDKGHIFASTACLGSQFSQLVLEYLGSEDKDGVYNKIDSFLTHMLDLFGSDFFIELQVGKTEEQVKYNELALRIAKGMSIPYIITNDVHYLVEEDKGVHSAFLKSRNEERETADFYDSTFLKSSDEVVEWLTETGMDIEDIETGLANTMKIHSKCRPIVLERATAVPTVPIPIDLKVSHLFKDHYEEYENIKFFAYSEGDSDRMLLWNIENGFREKAQAFNSVNLARIDIELKQIRLISEKLGQNLSAYYNLVDLIIDIMWDDDKGNSLVGVARGSVTGFYICYLTDITQLNPIEHNLPWWRHLHEDRPELPKVYWALNVNFAKRCA